MNEIQIKIKELLLNENGVCDKRHTEIEKLQIKNLSLVIANLNKKYEGQSILLDASSLQEMRKLSNQFIIKENGEVVSSNYPHRNKWYDSKSFDGIVQLTIKEKNYLLFFVLKGVERPGGHQDEVKQEIGSYTNRMNRNHNDDYHFFFILDGTYINKDIELIKNSDKYDVSTSENIETYIDNFIKKLK